MSHSDLNENIRLCKCVGGIKETARCVCRNINMPRDGMSIFQLGNEDNS